MQGSARKDVVFGQRGCILSPYQGQNGNPGFNDNWEVVAIHHAGGNLLVNSKGDKMFANEGILMSSVLPALGVADS